MEVKAFLIVFLCITGPDETFKLNGPASTKSMHVINPNGNIQEYRLGLLMYVFFSQKYHFVSGHFNFSELSYDLWGHNWKFVTVIRNPVKRFISHYFYNRFNNIDHHAIDEELEVFLRKPEAKWLECMMTKYFSGNPKGVNIDKAKHNIEKFSLIGDLDNINHFSETFLDYFGISLNIEKINTNPIDQISQQKHLTPPIMERIVELCQPDIELYQHIKIKHQTCNPSNNNGGTVI